MAGTHDFEVAATVSVASCTTCDCGNVYVRLHDDADRIFAVASMSAEMAERFAAAVREQADAIGKRGLSAIRCEGTA